MARRGVLYCLMPCVYYEFGSYLCSADGVRSYVCAGLCCVSLYRRGNNIILCLAACCRCCCCVRSLACQHTFAHFIIYYSAHSTPYRMRSARTAQCLLLYIGIYIWCRRPVRQFRPRTRDIDRYRQMKCLRSEKYVLLYIH